MAIALVAVALIGASPAHPPPRDAAEVAERWCSHDGRASAAPPAQAADACRAWLLHLWQLDEDTMDVGYLWVLQTLLERHPEPKIEAFVASWESRLPPGRGAIVFPRAQRRWLPKEAGEGFDRFHNWVSAPSGRPASRAVRFIDAFTSIEASGYVLTHQALVLLWAENTGLDLPPEVRDRRGELLRRIAAEHQSDLRPGDLSLERAMILLLFGELETERATAFATRALEAWDPETGRWTFEAEETIEFQGHRRRIRHGPHHPTAMALGAVKAYLDRFASAETASVETERNPE